LRSDNWQWTTAVVSKNIISALLRKPAPPKPDLRLSAFPSGARVNNETLDRGKDWAERINNVRALQE